MSDISDMSKLFDFYKFSDNVAIVTEKGISLTYQDFHAHILDKKGSLPKNRELVFLKVDNTYQSVLDYVACLYFHIPFLVVDKGIDEELFSNLVKEYKPNYIVDSGEISSCSSYKHNINQSLAMLLSTSGTTGTPKLVRLSYQNLISNSQSIINYLSITEQDTTITTLPLSYSYGISILNTHLIAKSKIVLNNESIISKSFWDKVSTFDVKSLYGVPFTYQMLKKLRLERFDTENIRFFAQAGGKLDQNTLDYMQKFVSNKKKEFFVMYGQTEASPRISYVPPGTLINSGCIGVPVPGGRLCLYDSNGNEILEPYTEGEIVYFGDNVMLGYAQSPQDLILGDTQLGTLYTGDIGYFDRDKLFNVSGRAKRFIKIFGVRVNLDEIDLWLLNHEVLGVSLGNDDNLLILVEKSTISNDELLHNISKKFNININVIKVRSVDFIPRTNGGKVDFSQIRNAHLEL